MELDGFLDAMRLAIVEEGLLEAQPHERRGTELRRGSETQADVAPLNTHVVQQQVRVRVDPFVGEGGDRVVAGHEARHMTARTSDGAEHLSPALPFRI